MLGPSSTGLVTLGARWPACMRLVPGIPLTLSLGCASGLYITKVLLLTPSAVGPSNTENPATKICSIEELCAFGGFHNKTPNQWWRFVSLFLSIFVGLQSNSFTGQIHHTNIPTCRACPLCPQHVCTIEHISAGRAGDGLWGLLDPVYGCWDIRVRRGVISLLEYFSLIILGHRNALGGNFSLVGAPSVGASGAIFGTVAVCPSLFSFLSGFTEFYCSQVMWIDLFSHWQFHYRPVRKVLTSPLHTTPYLIINHPLPARHAHH